MICTSPKSREHIPNKKELEKSKNDLRIFGDQVPLADPVNAEQEVVKKSGLQNSKRDSVEQQVFVDYIGFGQPGTATARPI